MKHVQFNHTFELDSKMFSLVLKDTIYYLHRSADELAVFLFFFLINILQWSQWTLTLNSHKKISISAD